MEKKRFEALSRICLNNWHYIDRKILSFQEGVNFFTGHSGSGKSTVIDAIQIVLYADTDGRSFFNKAASDDSNRTLIEYLRGMVNMGDNGENSYLRNHNFSTTIVLELRRTDTLDCQCVGVAFDVDTGMNEIVSRLFFWHEGPMPESDYRTNVRPMSTEEIKDYLMSHYAKEQYYLGSSNERFRKQLYHVYLGGLNEKRFPLLFKRAIPFRMNIKLEDFVKEYICMEEDIQIEDMQESVMQYGRMRKKISDTCEEIHDLEEIHQVYEGLKNKESSKREYSYIMDMAGLFKLKTQVEETQAKISQYEQDVDRQEADRVRVDAVINELEEKRRSLDRQIAASGYEELKAQLRNLNEMIERLSISKGKWSTVASDLKEWEKQDFTPNPVLWDIGRFKAMQISEDELMRLKNSIEDLRMDVQSQKKELEGELRDLNKQRISVESELQGIRQGNKYPKVLEDAKRYLSEELMRRTDTWVPIEILADLLDIPDDTWRNAVEGYLGNNKLLLVAEPKYVRQVMELYQELDENIYHSVSILDTDMVMRKQHPVKPKALAEEVVTSREDVRAYLDFLMGNVIKCQSIDELREHAIGITSDCMLYKGYRLQRINPDNYTIRAYIGKAGMRKRIRRLESELNEIQEKRVPLITEKEECETVLKLEALDYPLEDYLAWKKDMDTLPNKELEKNRLLKNLESLREKNITAWENELEETLKSLKGVQKQRDDILDVKGKINQKIESCKSEYLKQNEELLEREKYRSIDHDLELKGREYIAKKQTNAETVNFDQLRRDLQKNISAVEKEIEEEKAALREVRYQYLRKHPSRPFSSESQDNKEYEELLEHLRYADLDKLYKKADEQAKEAVELFKQDFIFKIRTAIREQMQRKDELNKIISKRSFGKDRYQFRITKNKGPDGRFYDMFMDNNLDINPAALRQSMKNQTNLFTMNHEEKYGDLLDELINIFIPPDHASPEEQEAARRNMDKYADYRTYLSFDMEQIIEGAETMKLSLSKMIKKNSGGEGQNPLYVALLASFAQAYRINLTSRKNRNPSIRLVVLDEAFSKMDAEKVASCIKLIRSFGFQALISATNDKIQNYLESVDKTFVFANPDKRQISIEEFERTDFDQLAVEEVQDDAD